MKTLIRISLAALASVFALILLNDAMGRHKSISSERRFERALQNDLTVALFYMGKSGDKELNRSIKDLRKTFKRVSKTDPFNYAELMFVNADLSKSKLETLADDYGVPQPEVDNPIIVLFKGGKQIAAENGFLSSPDIRKFIKKYFGKDIDSITKQKDKRRQRRLEESRRRAYDRSYRWPYYGYGHYGWGWPHYGYGWRYRRWYW